MHRLHFSCADIEKLKERLESADYNSPVNWNRGFELRDVLRMRNESLSDDYGQKCFYDSVKENSHPFILQIMFHIPLKDIPLYINHKTNIVRAIVAWRLDIAR